MVQYRNIGGFKEKIVGTLYYYGITHLGIKSDEYQVVCCAESHSDIWQIIKIVNKLAKRDGWKIKIHPDIRENEEMLKMADYVAGANKKSTLGELSHIGRHTVLNNAISDFDLRKAFKIYK